MPIGHRRSFATATGTMTALPSVTIDPNPPTPYVRWQAVALVDDGQGTIVLRPCGATSWGGLFYGFLAADATPGMAPVVMTGRGSRVTPIVENDDDLVPNRRVWLSTVAGRVVQTPPVTGCILCLGKAISDTEMVLITDMGVEVG